MALIPPEALPYFENMIYLPMLLIILEKIGIHLKKVLSN